MNIPRLPAWLVMMAAVLAMPAAGCDMRVRWNDDPPYSMRDAGGRVAGIYVELIEQTLARAGCRVQWVELPWARALVELQAGRLDMLPGALRRPERESYALWAEQGVTSPNRLYVRSSEREAFGAATRLTEVVKPGRRFGVQGGVIYGPDYAALLEDPAFRASLTQVTHRRSLWQMLDMGRLDAVLADEASARWELAQLGLQARIGPTSVVLSDEQAQVMFSRASVTPATVQRFREASAQLAREGTRARIIRKYLDEQP